MDYFAEPVLSSEPGCGWHVRDENRSTVCITQSGKDAKLIAAALRLLGHLDETCGPSEHIASLVKDIPDNDMFQMIGRRFCTVVTEEPALRAYLAGDDRVWAEFAPVSEAEDPPEQAPEGTVREDGIRYHWSPTNRLRLKGRKVGHDHYLQQLWEKEVGCGEIVERQWRSIPRVSVDATDDGSADDA